MYNSTTCATLKKRTKSLASQYFHLSHMRLNVPRWCMLNEDMGDEEIKQ